jgi:hypothetical protein
VSQQPDSDVVAAQRMLGKLRNFVADLDAEERPLFAALLAPGVAQAYLVEGDDEAAEVAGFGMTDWAPGRLPQSLAESIRAQGMHIELS